MIGSVCSICGYGIESHYTPAGEVYWTKGHNAQPVNDGRCCDTCNDTRVLPARMAAIRQTLNSEAKRND